MLKRYLYILACLLCFNSIAQTADSTKTKSNARGFYTLKIGVNTIPALNYNYDGNSSTTKKHKPTEYYKNYIASVSAGVFFSKRSFAEIAGVYSFPSYCDYDEGAYQRKISVNRFLFSALNYGYKIPLGKKSNGHFATRVGLVIGGTSASDTMYYSWGLSNGYNFKYFKKGLAIGYNVGVNLGFVLNKRTRFNIDCMYTYAVYYPTQIQTSSSYHHHQGAGYFIDGEGNYVYTYKPFSGPKIPIKMLSINVGLSWNF